MLDLKGVQRTIIGPFQKLEVEVGSTIAFVSGNVPRLVVREGSQAWDILEGQCLPVTGPKAQVINPFGVAAELMLGFSMLPQIRPPAVDLAARHAAAVQWAVTSPKVSLDAGEAAYSLAYVVAAGRSSYVVEYRPLDLAWTASDTTVLCLSAGRNFASYAPAAPFMRANVGPMDGRHRPDLAVFAGLAGATSFSSWRDRWAEGEAQEPPAIRTATMDSNSLIGARWQMGPGDVLMFRRPPGKGHNVQLVLTDLGASSEDWQ